MKDKTTKRRGVAAKLIPATCMLLVSATALVSSTYAWFTMSREVEVKNIKLTATVPADLQISAGQLSTLSGSGDGYTNNKGILVKQSTAANADNGNVQDPDVTVNEYWSNTIDLSNYYVMGKIMPASSTDGQDVFFTPNASGVGKTLNSGAKFYKAVDNGTVQPESTINTSSSKTHLASTLHAFTTEKGDGWLEGTGDYSSSGAYAKSTEWNNTNDDGYYVDIPLWIRSSSTDQDIDLAVDAYVTTDSKKDDDDLYLAARAVILNPDKSKTSKLLEIRPDAFSNDATIVDFMYTTNASGEAVSTIDGSNNPTYATVAHYDGSVLGSTDNILHIAKATAGGYGTPTKFWVRVWLEGEDPNCWNDNAGQNFSINLKFTRDAMSAAAGTDTYPDAISFSGGTGYAADGGLKTGDRLTFSVNGNSLTYEYNETTKWDRLTVSFPEAPMGTQYSVQLGSGSTTNVADEAALITWLNANVTTQSNVTTGVTVNVVDLATITKFNATVTNGATTYSVSDAAFTTGALNGKNFRVNGVTYTTKDALTTALNALNNTSTPAVFVIDVITT